MSDDPLPGPPAENWQSKPPFSERPLMPPEPKKRQEAPVTSPIEEDPSPDLPTIEVTTAPIPTTLGLVRPPQPGFQLLTPEDLTAEERRSVELQMTAYYHAHKLLNQVTPVDPPAPYEERFFIWKMIFQQVIPVASLIVASSLIVMIASMSGASGWGIAWEGLGLIVVLLVCAWFIYRAYYAWNRTILFCVQYETGIRRPRNRWLLLTEISLSVETPSLMTKDATRGSFTSFFNINSWRVSLDSPAQQDAFLDNLGFVRDGDRLKKTVDLTQRYLKQSGG